MKFGVKTKGHTDVVDITEEVRGVVNISKIKEGIALVFVPGSTAAITAIEYEDGVINDLRRVLEEIAPEDADYEHHKKWGDHNGSAHLRSAIIGPSFSVPVIHGDLSLGTWQQIVLIDFDDKPREREIIVMVK